MAVVFCGALMALALAVALPAHSATVQLTSSADYSGSPSVNAAGSVVAFESEADLAGGNADKSREVFVINSDGTGLQQLTTDAALSSCHPVISADGSVMVFQSMADLTGGNSDNSFEIFAINSDGTGLKQLTNTTWPSNCGHPATDGDGSLVAFASDGDLTGGNSDNSREVFSINSDGTGLRQLTSETNPAYASWANSVSADGSAVVLESEADLAGGNSDHSWEVFWINSDGTGLRQLTSDA
ncbi:MAG: hypothetical protein MUQ26_01850, partial [Armatimonadetes bacterium]|nr:hypothetical protein [Armatimonadota bacterium]